MSESSVVETEVKLAVPHPRILARLRQLRRIPGFTLGELREIRLTDTFKDSSDFRLLRAGLALRERFTGDRWLVTVKGVASSDPRLHRREELEHETDGRLRDRVDPSTAVGRRVAPILAEEALAELFSFSQIRHTRPVSRRGRKLAELSLDEITMRADNRSYEFFEVEVEATGEDGVPSLPRIGRWLADAFALPFDRRTKFERAVEFFGTPVPGLPREEPRSLRPEMDFTTALHRLLVEQLSEVTRNGELILESPSVAAVHDMRVAAQRARTLLASFPRESFEARPISRFLKDLRDRLGVVRDLQVLPKTIGCAAAQIENELTSMAVLRNRAREAEEIRALSLQEHLRSEWYRRGRDELLTSPPAPARPDYRRAPRQLRDALPPLLLQRMSLADALHRTVRPGAEAQFHELRKVMKKVRYVLEFFQPILGDAGRRLYGAAVGVQTPLGMLQDSVVARQLSRTLDVDDPAVGDAFSSLAAAQEESIAEAWIRYCDPRLRERVFEEMLQI